MLDGNVGGEGPEVGVGDEALLGVLFGDGFEEGEGDSGEACVQRGSARDVSKGFENTRYVSSRRR